MRERTNWRMNENDTTKKYQQPFSFVPTRRCKQIVLHRRSERASERKKSSTKPPNYLYFFCLAMRTRNLHQIISIIIILYQRQFSQTIRRFEGDTPNIKKITIKIFRLNKRIHITIRARQQKRMSKTTTTKNGVKAMVMSTLEFKK